MTPKIRQWLYTAAAVATAIIPLLVVYGVIGSETASAWTSLVAALGALGATGAGTAAVVTARQRKEGTLDFTGTPAHQAVTALRATVAQAGVAQTDLREVIRAVSEVIPAALSVAEESPLSTTDPASADYRP